MLLKNKLVLALDVPTADEALALVKELHDLVGTFKIGMELFCSVGPTILEKIYDATKDNHIFLDLKLRDIPETIGRTVKALSKFPVDYLTISYNSNNNSLVQATANASGIGIIAVQHLTSDNLKRTSASDNTFFYESATAAGCFGVVCSAAYCGVLKGTYPNLAAVVPGIRLEGSSVEQDDQKQIATPRYAIQQKADFLVVGRPIRDSKDRRGTTKNILEECALG